MPKPTVSKTPLATKPPFVMIHVDGSCHTESRIGGWAAILRRIDAEGHVTKTRRLSARVEDTTNVRMEITAAIEALKAMKKAELPVVVVSNSQTVKLAMTEWLPGWRASGWKRAKGRAVANADLWPELDRLAGTQRIEWCWTQSRAGDQWNEEVDALARRQWGHGPRA